MPRRIAIWECCWICTWAIRWRHCLSSSATRSSRARTSRWHVDRGAARSHRHQGAAASRRARRRASSEHGACAGRDAGQRPGGFGQQRRYDMNRCRIALAALLLAAGTAGLALAQSSPELEPGVQTSPAAAAAPAHRSEPATVPAGDSSSTRPKPAGAAAPAAPKPAPAAAAQTAEKPAGKHWIASSSTPRRSAATANCPRSCTWCPGAGPIGRVCRPAAQQPGRRSADTRGSRRVPAPEPVLRGAGGLWRSHVSLCCGRHPGRRACHQG